MAGYVTSAGFTLRNTVKLWVEITTTLVSGGTEVNVVAYIQRDSGEIREPYGSGTRYYTVENGRTISTSGTLTPTGSASFSYDFRTQSEPISVWSGFNRYVEFGYSSTYVEIEVNVGGLLGVAVAGMTVPLFSAPPYFPFFPPYFPFFPPFFPPYFPFFPPFFPPYFPFFPPFFPPYFPPTPIWSSNVLASSSATEGQSYSDSVTALYVTSYALSTGTLPSGITVNTDGTITGTPANGSAGSYDFVVSATGDGGTIYTDTLNITVADDGGTVKVYNSTASQWETANVFVYDEANTTWVEGEINIYNDGSGSWDKSL